MLGLKFNNLSISDQTQCWIELGEPWRWQVYMCLISSSLFFIPAIIISACYAIILRTIWAKGAILGLPGGCITNH